MILELMDEARRAGASDLHLVSGSVPMIRVEGVLKALNGEVLKAEDTAQCVEELGAEDLRRERDFSFSSNGKRKFFCVTCIFCSKNFCLNRFYTCRFFFCFNLW